MNVLAAQNISFLFAVDFELSEGILIENLLSQQDVLFRIPSATNAQRSYANGNKQTY